MELDENSTIDLEAIKAAIEQLLADAKVADAKLVANEAAYVRLSDEIAAVQTRLDEVKATIEKDYAIVAAQFVGVESSIQYDINKKKDELKAQYEPWNSTRIAPSTWRLSRLLSSSCSLMPRLRQGLTASVPSRG